jgi:hypothetical protein
VLHEREPASEGDDVSPPAIETPLATKLVQKDADAHETRGTASTSVPGIALDDMTGQPIPWLDVELVRYRESASPIYKCKTSLDGTFVVDGLRAGIPYRLRFSDVAADFQALCKIDLEPPPAGGSRPFKVPIGPTYFLDIRSDSPVDVARLRARLNSDVPIVPSGTHARPPTSPWRAVRVGGVPWVRFNASVRNRASGDGTAPKLLVASEDGLHVGSVVVPGTVGAYTTPLEVKLESVGAIHGVVVGRDGARRGKVRIALERASNDLPLRAFSGLNDAVVTGANGEFSLGGLFPGDYKVRATASGSYPQSVIADVVGGRTIDIRIDMEPKDTGTVRGSLVSTFGAVWREPPLVCLTGIGGSKELCARCTMVEPPKDLGDKSGRLVDANFEIRGVPYGQYDVTVILPTTQGRSEYAWNLASVDLHSEEATVLVEFRQLSFDYGGKFAVFDANNGRPIVKFDVLDYTDTHVHVPVPQGWFGVSAEPSRDDRFVNNAIGLHATVLSVQRGLTSDKLAIHLAKDAPLRWMVVADGYQPEWGDERAFEWEPNGGQPKPCVVRLKPGWGAMVYAFRDDDVELASPLRGVSVIGDGSELGVTDVDGLVGVRVSKRPICLTLECFGYHLVKAFGLDSCRLGPDVSALATFMSSN